MSMKQKLLDLWQCIKEKFISIKERIIQAYRLRDNYKDLAPIDNISNGKEYLKALHWAIKNKRIKNIAITGPYGSGKSSIINSYLKRHPIIKAKHLRISMATFIENASEENGERKKINIDPNQVEEGILKQLFYKVNHRKIPQSRYRKLYKISFLSAWLVVFLVVVAFVFFSFVFAPEFFDNTLALITNAGAKFEIPAAKAGMLFVGILLLLITFIAYIGRRLGSKIRINEVKVKDTSIGTENEDKESIFNKNMDEIVYFFEETKYRVVFFEDLDRLDSSKIFVQLRELNTLLNNSNTIKHPIVFVYAVKDDIFTEEDRTKFFEFIIPVIPVINSTNSGEILLDLFKANGSESFKHDITFDYILDVSPYISDMRVLQNIHNEFLLYKRTLRAGQGLELSDKMMLSLIIFKNLYPKDFADLQLEDGVVKQAFKDKEDYIDKRLKELDTTIKLTADLIIQVKKDALKSTKEVKISMLTALANWKGIVTRTEKGWSTEFTIQEILDDAFDLSKLCSDENRTVDYRDWRGNTSSRQSVPDFTKICGDYYERYQYLKKFEETQLETLRKETEENRQRKVSISKLSLKQLIAEYGDKAVFSNAVQQNKLLVFMIRKGYIDEKYVSYVNYFKGSSITTDDMNYILSVKNHEAKPFDYAISKVDQVVHRLLPHEFEQREVLNFTVLEYLLEAKDCEDRLLAFIRQLSDGTDFSWKFIDEFVMQTSYLPRFIQLLSQNWDMMWDHIYNDPVLTYNRKALYLSLLCSYTGSDNLLKLNGEDRLISKFFEEHDDILQILASVETEKMVSIIPSLEISFSKLKIEGVDSEVLACIFDNCFYQINPEMICNIVAYKNPTLCSRLETQNYSTIIDLDYTPLTEYIQKNLAFYIDNIVLIGANRNENINQIIDLIKRSITEVERCQKIIRFQSFCLSNIDLCCSEEYSKHKSELRSIWDTLLECNKVEPLWENIDRYWSHFGWTSALCDYVSEHVDILENKSSECIYDDALREEFIQSDVKPPEFTKLLKHMHLADFDIPLVNVHEVNVKAMIEEHYFSFTADRYKELSECYPELCKTFILENKDDFLATATEITLKAEVFEPLVLSDNTDTIFKEKVMSLYGTTLMSGKIAEYICLSKLAISKEVFDAAWTVLDECKKKELMFIHLDILNANDFEKCFAELGAPYQDLKDRSRRHNETLPESEEHKRLVKRLQQVNYITSYECGGYITEYDRDERKMVERPSILCRVKATGNTSKKK